MGKIKYLFLVFIAGSLVIVFSSKFVFAQPSLGGGSFCEMISKRLSSGPSKLDLEGSAEALKSKRVRQEENKTKTREAQDNRKNELYVYLDNIAETEEQKIFIAEFKTKIDSIFAIYREKQDLIISELQNNSEAVRVEDKPKLEESKKEDDNQMQDLLKEAKEACDSGKYSEDEIQEEFLIRSESFRVAGEQQSARGRENAVHVGDDSKKVSQEMAEFIGSKKQEMKEAKDEFAVETRKAKEKLLEAFR